MAGTEAPVSVKARLAEPDDDIAEIGEDSPGPVRNSDAMPQTSETSRLNPGDLSPSTSDTKKHSVQIKDPPVSETRGYEVVKIEEKHGPFHSAIPVMPLPLAIIFCLLNMFVPGSGTLFSAPACFCCPTRHSSSVKAFFYMILAAFLQVLTFLVIVGWIWSIRWGIVMIQLSRAPKRIDNGTLPYYVRRQSSIEHQSTSKP